MTKCRFKIVNVAVNLLRHSSCELSSEYWPWCGTEWGGRPVCPWVVRGCQTSSWCTDRHCQPGWSYARSGGAEWRRSPTWWPAGPWWWGSHYVYGLDLNGFENLKSFNLTIQLLYSCKRHKRDRLTVRPNNRNSLCLEIVIIIIYGRTLIGINWYHPNVNDKALTYLLDEDLSSGPGWSWWAPDFLVHICITGPGYRQEGRSGSRTQLEVCTPSDWDWSRSHWCASSVGTAGQMLESSVGW